ncbi:hypothetical protein PT2222_430007 [Paraburkholderia tropica]
MTLFCEHLGGTRGARGNLKRPPYCITGPCGDGPGRTGAIRHAWRLARLAHVVAPGKTGTAIARPSLLISCGRPDAGRSLFRR